MSVYSARLSFKNNNNNKRLCVALLIIHIADGSDGRSSFPRRLHHHYRAMEEDNLPAAGRAENAEGNKKSDIAEDDYPSDFRWPESYFDLEASSDVAVVVGQTAFLVCRVAVAGNWTVSPPAFFFYFLIDEPLTYYIVRPGRTSVISSGVI